MAWDDPSSLWWLRPNQDANHSAQISSGFALGMRQTQQQQEMQLSLKQLALQQQYRTDQLDAENRRVDGVIENYQRLKDQSDAEQEDMQKLSFAMPELQAGIQVPLDLKTPKGLKALNDIHRQVDYANSIKHENAAAVKAMSDFRKQLAMVWGADPASASDISTELNKTGKITDWMQARVNDVINNLVVPKQMTPHPGMVVSSRTIPTAEGGRFTEINPASRVGGSMTKADEAKISISRDEVKRYNKEIEKESESLSMMTPGSKSHTAQTAKLAGLKAARQRELDNIDRIGGVSPNTTEAASSARTMPTMVQKIDLVQPGVASTPTSPSITTTAAPAAPTQTPSKRWRMNPDGSLTELK